MSSMFPIVNVDVPGGPSVDASYFRPVIVPGREAGAAGHWRLKGDEDSLTDDVGAVLTPKNTEATFDALSMTTADGGLHGYETPWTESSTEKYYSWIVAAKRPVIASNIHVIAGTQQSGNTTGGGALWLANGQVQFSRGFGGVSLQDQIEPPTSVVAGDIVMVGWSQSSTTGIGVLSNGSELEEVSRATDMAHSARKIALGNCFTNIASWLYGMQFYTFIVWLEPKTTAELKLVMRRERLRLANDGLILK